jgi:3-hydroxyacyl-CoA dehydrogenase
LDFLTIYGEKFLGKQLLLLLKTLLLSLETVLEFLVSLFLVKEMGLTIEEVDKLTGPYLGRPKSTLEQLMLLLF